MLQFFHKIEEGLLDEKADHAGVGSAAGDGCSLQVVLPDIVQQGLSKSVVASLFELQLLIGVVSFPAFLDCVDVEDALLLTVLNDIFRGSWVRVSQGHRYFKLISDKS